MGLFDTLKKNYDKDEDLKDLEELMYDNESDSKNKRSINDMIKSFELGEGDSSKNKETDVSMYDEMLNDISKSHIGKEGPSGLDEKTKKQQADVQKEEEKYDYLLNSVQAQTLIQKVDGVSRNKDTSKGKSASINKDILRNKDVSGVKDTSGNKDVSEIKNTAENKNISGTADISWTRDNKPGTGKIKEDNKDKLRKAQQERMSELYRNGRSTVAETEGRTESRNERKNGTENEKLIEKSIETPVKKTIGNTNRTPIENTEEIDYKDKKDIYDKYNNYNDEVYADEISIIDNIINEEKDKSDSNDIITNMAGMSVSEVGSFVKSQCDICDEAARYIENAKVEYDSVTDYYEDIQKIENAPDDIRRELLMAADRVDNLSVDRRILKTPDNKLSNRAYRNMEMYEAEFPEAINKLRRAEDDKNAIARDIRMVKMERSMCRMDAKDLVKKQLRIKRYAQLISALLVMVFVVFVLIMAASKSTDYLSEFITIALLTGAMAVGLFAYLKSVERKVYVTENKLNKATALLNKLKIKYVNAVSVLDYQCGKYYIKNAYELEQKYQAYVEMKEEQKKILEVTNNLTSAEADLTHILGRLGVIDTHIWIAQVKAILNPKEMVEVRHNLSVRRQKLRHQIQYNENRIEDAKNNIKNIARKNPAYAKEAMQILDMYDKM